MTSFADALKITSTITGARLREHDDAIAALNKRIDALQTEADRQHARIAALETDVERLQEAQAERDLLIKASCSDDFASQYLTALTNRARIAAPVAPESVVNVSEVSQEPRNATERHFHTGLIDFTAHAEAAEVAAALRVHRKVQACKDYRSGAVVTTDGETRRSAADLLAWLKEGEA